MSLSPNEMVKRGNDYKIPTPATVLRKWKQAKIQELKSRIFSAKNSLRDTDLKIAQYQQLKEELEFGKKPELEGHIEMMELELEELKNTIDV